MEFIKKVFNKTTQGPFWVMYDNDCPFCCKMTYFFKKLDYFDKIQWVKKDFEGDFPKEALSKIDSTIVVYDPSKHEVFYHSEAVFKIISCLPLGLFFVGGLKIPGVLKVCDFYYKRISKNRHYICSKRKK